MRAEQIVSEMVAEALAHQAEALSDNTGRLFEETFAEVLEIPDGRRLVELAGGPARRARGQKPARLCTSEGGHALTP